LRVETLEGWKGGVNSSHRFELTTCRQIVEICGDAWKEERREEQRLITVVDHRQCQRSRDRWTEGIPGPGHARMIIFLEWATISTIILVTGYVSAREGLWGKKWVGWKPLLPTPTIMH
jgi:hypothetical protein